MSRSEPDHRAGPSDRSPSAEELAAIVAAVTLAWPEPAAPSTAPETGQERWRFSGRWWAPDAGARRRRLDDQTSSRRPGRAPGSVGPAR